MDPKTEQNKPTASDVIDALQMSDSQRKWLEFRERIHDLNAEIQEQAARDFAGADLGEIDAAVETISRNLWDLFGDALQDDIQKAREALAPVVTR